MMVEQTAQQLIDAFFSALALVQLEACQTLLGKLDKLAAQEPAYRSWHTYLLGILANELYRDWAEGERIFKLLLETDLDPTMHGRVLIALGRTYDYQGHWRQAISTYEQCLTIFNRPDQGINRAKIWKNMAISYEKGYVQGEFGDDALQQAIQYCQLALETLQILENLTEEELWLEATTWNTLGVVYRSLNNWSQATRCYERRIALGHTLDDHYGIGMASNNLGEIFQGQGPEKWPEAQQAYREALKIYREFGDKYEQVDVLANLGSLHDEMGRPDQALAYYDQAITVIESLRAGVSEEKARAGFFATTADTYAHAVLLSIQTNQTAKAFHYLERARSRAFLDLLGADSPYLKREEAEDVLSLSEVQAALPSGALLLEYFTTGLTEAKISRKPGRQRPYRHRQPPAQTFLFAISRDAVQVLVLDFDPNDIFRPRLKQVVERYFLDSQMRASLYDKLIAPVEAHLRGAQRVYLIPHGPLHYIPFQALEPKTGRSILDRESLYLSYAPSATILLGHCRSTAQATLVPCLAFGYNGEGGRMLRYAEEEAKSIARLFDGQALTGPGAKKESLYRLGPQANSLHFSCHGHFDPREPMTSALHLGANETLSSEEILRNLRLKAHLVTLSACETGLSRVQRGDELMGLMRAFIFAGTPAIVSTLWRVEEHSTRILMEKFYQELRGGVGKAAALKHAQRYLRRLTQAEVQEMLAEQFLLEDPQSSSIREDPSSPEQAPPSPVALRQKAQSQLAQRSFKYRSSPDKAETLSSLIGIGPLIDDPEARIFSDPYFWAPFMLVGDFEAE